MNVYKLRLDRRDSTPSATIRMRLRCSPLQATNERGHSNVPFDLNNNGQKGSVCSSLWYVFSVSGGSYVYYSNQGVSFDASLWPCHCWWLCNFQCMVYICPGREKWTLIETQAEWYSLIVSNTNSVVRVNERQLTLCGSERNEFHIPCVDRKSIHTEKHSN